jgi:peptidoglycan hydrolase CwlO-like protein
MEERRKLANQFTEYKRRSMQEKAVISEELAVANLKIKQGNEEVGNLKKQLESIEALLKEHQSKVHELTCKLEQRDEQLKQRHTGFVEITSNKDDEMIDNGLCDLADLISDRSGDEFVSV